MPKAQKNSKLQCFGIGSALRARGGGRRGGGPQMYLGWPDSRLFRKAKPEVAPLELSFVNRSTNKVDTVSRRYLRYCRLMTR